METRSSSFKPRSDQNVCSICSSFNPDWSRQELKDFMHAHNLMNPREFDCLTPSTTMAELQTSVHKYQCQGCTLIYNALKYFVDPTSPRDPLQIFIRIRTDRFSPTWNSESSGSGLFRIELEWKDSREQGTAGSLEFFSTEGRHRIRQLHLLEPTSISLSTNDG